MHVHILGICGTFMGGVAILAKEKGYQVSGSDAAVYPPMSTQLREQQIDLKEGYCAENLLPKPKQVIIGNAMSRGNPEVEAVLAQNIAYQSGPQWLAEHILADRQVLAVAGTHGKTTTASLLAWILEVAGLQPGFLIGGVPKNFGLSARLGKGKYFVIEADEYDSAFFDKRSKFIHYHPHCAILNNLEFDHADIFPNLEAIQLQFHHLLRTVPNNGLLVVNGSDHNLAEVLHMGCWTPTETFNGQDNQDWHAELINADGSSFKVYWQDTLFAEINWSLLGMHNVNNALAAIAAARHVGVEAKQIVAALAKFSGVKRRLEVRGEINGIKVYDDFAHHPTAIATTLYGLRKHVGSTRIVAVVELGSYTMRTGHYGGQIYSAFAAADRILFLQPKDANWDIHREISQLDITAQVFANVEAIVKDLAEKSTTGDHILVMSNKGFDGIHEKLLYALEQKHSDS